MATPVEHVLIDWMLDQMTEAERAAVLAELARVATIRRAIALDPHAGES